MAVINQVRYDHFARILLYMIIEDEFWTIPKGKKMKIDCLSKAFFNVYYKCFSRLRYFK